MHFEAHFMLKSEDNRRICFHDVQDNEMPINPFGIESIFDYSSTPLRGRSVPTGRARPLTTSKVLPLESTKRKKVFFRLVLSSLIRTFADEKMIAMLLCGKPHT